MLTAPIPLFDDQMAVQAYLLRCQTGNDLFSTTQATGIFDGGSNSVALEMLNRLGLEAFTLGKQVFVPVNHIMLLGNLDAQCTQPADKVIFLFEGEVKPQEPYISRIAQLREKGFRFAARNLYPLAGYEQLLRQLDFFFLSQRDDQLENSEALVKELRASYRAVGLVATQIYGEDGMNRAKQLRYDLYESRFFRVPVTQGEGGVSPLKMNAIRLINTVQDENFEFEQVTAVVQQDPSLTVSLLQMVNARSYRNRIKTIAQAVAMLGQKEVRKWVTTAVSRSMGSDRPSEVTRISLLRAKFAENLAPLFELTHLAQELFLMGLFSVLDIILEVPMEEALKAVSVSDLIGKALLSRAGVFAPVLTMLTDYESANWQAVSRLMIVHDIGEEDLSAAYMDALEWYRGLIAQADETPSAAAEPVAEPTV